MLRYITDDDTIDIMNIEKKPVLVYFGAEWCGPCKSMAPILESLSTETRFDIIKADIATSQQLAEQMNIQSVPTMNLIKDGRIVWKSTGSITKDRLLESIKYYI